MKGVNRVDDISSKTPATIAREEENRLLTCAARKEARATLVCNRPPSEPRTSVSGLYPTRCSTSLTRPLPRPTSPGGRGGARNNFRLKLSRPLRHALGRGCDGTADCGFETFATLAVRKQNRCVNVATSLGPLVPSRRSPAVCDESPESVLGRLANMRCATTPVRRELRQKFSSVASTACGPERVGSTSRRAGHGRFPRFSMRTSDLPRPAPRPDDANEERRASSQKKPSETTRSSRSDRASFSASSDRPCERRSFARREQVSRQTVSQDARRSGSDDARFFVL